MSQDEFDWHASELAKTNPNVMPPEVPDTARAVVGEVEAKANAPELVEISTVRVLSDLVETRHEPAPAPAGHRRAWVWVLAVVGLALALASLSSSSSW